MSAVELDAQQPSAANARASVAPRAIAPVAASGGWSYRNCREARAAGAAPLYAGQPGYGQHMDGDGDGIACEPYVGPR
ncbi:calcium-binding protein [Sphingobium sp. Leaf26]|uniref:excalibur calcium-binding domain-containing protein n=1 Tax=Sphingobium sp. Leaf26 TaxID=1735693 RepID=UPI0006F6832D|nr:excalibur calcium-binding domain-containing protein [Sphingobium sp. Leaf26]KQN05048.1 calcium-binding protein [Sphingobium sp. Leaf26]